MADREEAYCPLLRDWLHEFWSPERDRWVCSWCGQPGHQLVNMKQNGEEQ